MLFVHTRHSQDDAIIHVCMICVCYGICVAGMKCRDASSLTRQLGNPLNKLRRHLVNPLHVAFVWPLQALQVHVLASLQGFSTQHPMQTKQRLHHKRRPQSGSCSAPQSSDPRGCWERQRQHSPKPETLMPQDPESSTTLDPESSKTLQLYSPLLNPKTPAKNPKLRKPRSTNMK